LAQTILSLEPNELYPPSKVARRIVDPVQQREEYQKWRKRAGDWVRYHCKEPDGQKGNFNAWLGSTWQEFIDPADRRRVEKSRARAAQAHKGSHTKKRWAAALAAAVILMAALTQLPHSPKQDTEPIAFEPTMFKSVTAKQQASPSLDELLAWQSQPKPSPEPAQELAVSQVAPENTAAKTNLSTLEFARKMRQLHLSWHLQTFSHDSFISLVETEREQEAPSAVARIASYPYLLTRSNIAMTPL
jgi:hypothetical protein